MYSIWTALGFRGNPYDHAYLPGSEEGAELFCGRASELLRAQVGIASGGSHVSIEGDAGVGKTSLAQVAAYEMFRQVATEGKGSLFIPVPTSLQLSPDALDFERSVWRNVANALISNETIIRRVGRDVPDFGGLAHWLNSPTVVIGGSVSLMGFGAAGTRGVNTSSGFSESGFNSIVRRELSRVFPSPAAGAVVCILDNLELLGASDAARHALETLRASLLEVSALRWVFVGSKGIITSARSTRLSGFIDLPLQLLPLTVDEGVELVQRRLDYWGTELAHPPVQAEDFRYLYRTMGLNLRDSLSVAQQFAKEYYVEFVSPGRELPSSDERPLYFQSWLADKADNYLAEVSGVPDDVWKIFDRICAAGGKVSVHLDDHDDLGRLNPLANARLLELESDPKTTGLKVGTVTAHGWLCASARPRATGAKPVNTSPPLAFEQGGGLPWTLNEIDDAALPHSCQLTDILGPGVFEPENLARLWRSTPSSTAAVVGLSTDGPFVIDLVRDGPHGLIAGTTGSGKSELLQSIVVSFAVVNRPDAMNFILIDYKGGAAFKDFLHLPHTVGIVTDLDTHSVERALVSLSAELRRRQRELAAVGMTDLGDYESHSQGNPPLPPMPRLVLVIDEFAAMARELPEFVSGLVDIGRLGRSLGIHLLLATQRPSGVVSPEIRVNTNLRICLRVTDTSDSTDVIESPDAARIAETTPGRAIARLGDGDLLPFQTGWIGGMRAGTGHAATGSADVGITDLSALVSAIREAAAAEGAEPQRAPWLPPLPLAVQASDLPDVPGSADLPAVPYGILDLPSAQRQQPLCFDFAREGHLLVVGSARSGRSQLLRTLATTAAARISAGDLHLYGLDCGNGALLPLADLPHTGAVVARTQTERVIRLLDRLGKELGARQALLADGGYADITEQRRAQPARPLPHVMVLLDRWEGFASTLGEIDNGRLADAVLTLMREGASVGMHLAVTGDRSLASGRIRSLTDNRLVLRLDDRGDYSLLGLNPRKLPDEIPPGRAFDADTGTEAQIALLGTDPAGQAQATVIARIAAETTRRDAGVPRERRAFRVDPLPERVGFEQAWAIHQPAGGSQLFALVGVGGDELAAFGPDLLHTPAFVVGGPNGSGRTTLLATMIEAARRGGGAVVVGAPRPSPLRELTGKAGVLDVICEAAADEAQWRSAIDSGGNRPVVVVLDDAEALRDSPAGELFRSIVRGLLPGKSLILCGHPDGICTGLSGWQVDAKKVRRGALLSPQELMDGDLIGIRLPRSVVGRPIQPGRALLHLGDGTLLTVQVPLYGPPGN